MLLVTHELNMNGTEICLNCPHMNPITGYCPKAGEYVNAFWACHHYEEREAEIQLPPRPVRKHRVSPLKGVRFTADRTRKRCSRCGKIKPLEEFVKSKRNADGHSCYCFECNRLKNQEERAKKKKLKALKYADDHTDK
jgi:hypothetical protein